MPRGSARDGDGSPFVAAARARRGDQAPGDQALHGRCAEGRASAIIMNMPSLAPSFLLSMPQLCDPNFRRTVVLLCKHSEEGAFGLVVNRPLATTGRVVVDLDPPVTPDHDLQVWIGGPVEPQRSWILVGSGDATSACGQSEPDSTEGAPASGEKRLRPEGGANAPSESEWGWGPASGDRGVRIADGLYLSTSPV